jgi:tetratricopeptide (TPR) repeat protein
MHPPADMASVDELQARGAAALEAGRLEEAEACYRELLALQQHPGLLNNLGLVLVAQRRYAEAVPLFESSLAARGRAPNVLVALANALNFCNRPEEAIRRCEEVLAIDARHADARHNKAVALRALNRHREAIAELKALLALDPNDADAEYNLALSELVSGDYAAGWRHYEARWRGPRAHPPAPLAGIPAWRPGDDLRGRSVLVQAEQGLGDTLQFIRFIPSLARRCASVRVQVQDALVELVRRRLPDYRVDALGTTLPGEIPQARIALLSLPLALGLEDESAWSQGGAYLRADPARVAEWRTRLAGDRLRVGFAWRGSPGHRHDHNRSVAVETLQPWIEAMGAAGVELLALQKDASARERDWLGRFAHVRVLADELADFDATAAVVALLDRVVAVDTALAHLAGGMGRPTTVLLPFSPDWRWRLDRDSSALYPGMQLIRQRTIGDWNPVIDELTAGAARWERAP